MARKKQIAPTANELLALIDYPERPAGWLTVREVMEATGGLSYSTVAQRLDRQVDLGLAEMQRAYVGGRWVRVYRVKPK